MSTPLSNGVAGSFALYWKLYGGSKAVFASPYFVTSLAISFLCQPIWSVPSWVEMPLAILPNVLGFSLGGYAILIGFSDEKLKRILVKSKAGSPSAFLRVNATFVHFIVVQVVALVAGVLSKAWMKPSLHDGWLYWLQIVSSLAGFTAFTYSISLAVAATFAIFQIGQWFNRANQPRTAAASPHRESEDSSLPDEDRQPSRPMTKV